ncbi:MAG: polymorphic toxin-type HINT domain-containing protein [Isosphaeraceae bacterium]|nr:polymorphic toxin-type HINT domain-containing protein [Isosphaeraceae bacterium]
MVTPLLIGSLLAAVPPSSSTAIDDHVRAAYRDAQARAGSGPSAHVRLALWCETHGLQEERTRHLAAALAADPSNTAARGLLGLVAYRGRWQHPEEIADAARSDKALQATLAEYNAQREGMPETADAHWKLALWCDQHGLAPEARAHFTAVTRLDPNRSDAWNRLGCRKFRGRWLTEPEIAAEQAESEAQRKADAHWTPLLKAWWKDWLADKDHRIEAEAALRETLEPRAVPTLHALLGVGTPEQQLIAVLLLDRLDSSEATQELSRLAVMGRSDDVRRSAVEILSRRDPNEVIEPLVALMHDPLGVSVASGGGPGVIGELRVEDEQSILQKTYVVRRRAPTVNLWAPRNMNFGFIGAVMRPPSQRTAQQQLSRDLRSAAQRNAARGAINASAREVLVALTSEDQGSEPAAWRRWLADQRGYADAPSTAPKPVIARVAQFTSFTSAGFHSYCFGKGTLVRTLFGLQPIETLRIGDRILAEDPGTGALSYQPIVVVRHNPPSPTLRIRFGGDEIVSTPIHRFWRAGKGWVLARDLKRGDTVRVLGGTAEVASVESDEVQPVFNLELPESHTFFVGPQGALVHDDTRARPVSSPFDAPLALATKPRR